MYFTFHYMHYITQYVGNVGLYICSLLSLEVMYYSVHVCAITSNFTRKSLHDIVHMHMVKLVYCFVYELAQQLPGCLAGIQLYYLPRCMFGLYHTTLECMWCMYKSLWHSLPSSTCASHSLASFLSSA